MRAPIGRTILAGVAGGFALNVAMLLTFRLLGFGLDARGILLNPSLQSPKLIAVWTTLPPPPLIVTHPLAIGLALVGFGILHAFLYRWLAPAWPPGIGRRALRMALLLLVLPYLFFEFFTPFNQLHEPVGLVIIELAFWGVVALAEGFTLAWLME
ncbi:MAG: hypothetical protein ACE147_12320 [Candidatus Methylomirabilales bacterium]